MLGKLKSRIARWAVLRNKLEALKVLVNESDIYNIMSALRGPDTQNYDLKYIFTARIRHLAGMDCKRSDAHCRDKKVVSIRDVMEALKSINADDEHYLGHVTEALIEFKHKGLIDRDEFLLLYELADIMKKVSIGYFTRETAETLVKSLAKRFKGMFKV